MSINMAWAALKSAVGAAPVAAAAATQVAAEQVPKYLRSSDTLLTVFQYFYIAEGSMRKYSSK